MTWTEVSERAIQSSIEDACLANPIVVYDVVPNVSIYWCLKLLHSDPAFHGLTINSVLETTLYPDVDNDSRLKVLYGALAIVAGLKGTIHQREFRLREDIAVPRREEGYSHFTTVQRSHHGICECGGWRDLLSVMPASLFEVSSKPMNGWVEMHQDDSIGLWGANVLDDVLLVELWRK
jgi:hypothetical protein